MKTALDNSAILNQDQCLQIILSSILNKEPSSFIRKGDGENIFLGYKKLPKIPFLKYRKKLIHFNIRIWDRQFQTLLKKEFTEACRSATILGISPPEHRHGFWSIEEEIISMLSLENIQYADVNFHMEFIKLPRKNKLMNPIAEDIIRNRKIGIISHCAVENFLNHYNSKVIVRLEIPKRRAKFQRMTKKKYDMVLSKIKKYCSLVDIWLVAAGIYAKPFCEYIRQNEGIGIDIGSSMDSWINEYHSRGHLRKLMKEYNTKNI